MKKHINSYIFIIVILIISSVTIRVEASSATAVLSEAIQGRIKRFEEQDYANASKVREAINAGDENQFRTYHDGWAVWMDRNDEWSAYMEQLIAVDQNGNYYISDDMIRKEIDVRKAYVEGFDSDKIQYGVFSKKTYREEYKDDSLMSYRISIMEENLKKLEEALVARANGEKSDVVEYTEIGFKRKLEEIEKKYGLTTTMDAGSLSEEERDAIHAEIDELIEYKRKLIEQDPEWEIPLELRARMDYYKNMLNCSHDNTTPEDAAAAETNAEIDSERDKALEYQKETLLAPKVHWGGEGAGTKITNPITDTDEYNAEESFGDASEAVKIGAVIIRAIRTIGIIFSVIALMIYGIRYMFASIEEKAQYKETIIPWFIGGLLLTTGTYIVEYIYDIASRF